MSILSRETELSKCYEVGYSVDCGMNHYEQMGIHWLRRRPKDEVFVANSVPRYEFDDKYFEIATQKAKDEVEKTAYSIEINRVLDHLNEQYDTRARPYEKYNNLTVVPCDDVNEGLILCNHQTYNWLTRMLDKSGAQQTYEEYPIKPFKIRERCGIPIRYGCWTNKIESGEMDTKKIINGNEYEYVKQIGDYAYLYYCKDIDSKSIVFDATVSDDVEMWWDAIDI